MSSLISFPVGQRMFSKVLLFFLGCSLRVRAQTHHLSIILNIRGCALARAKKLTRNGDPYPFYDDGAIDAIFPSTCSLSTRLQSVGKLGKVKKVIRFSTFSPRHITMEFSTLIFRKLVEKGSQICNKSQFAKDFKNNCMW